MEEKFVITITRQFGSLGRPIAQKMSEMLGIEFFDRDIVDETSKKLNLPQATIDEKEESALKIIGNSFARMAYPLGSGTNDIQDEIFETQQNVIKFLVDKKSCIVVGRCADFVLSEYENALHIYIYAPYEARIENSIKELGLSHEEAIKMINKVDEARESYHLHYSGFKPDDKNFKDVMVDSSFLGIDGTAEYLVNLIRKKFSVA